MNKQLSRTTIWILAASIAAVIIFGTAIYFTASHITAIEQAKHQLEKDIRTTTLVKASFIADAHARAMNAVRRNRLSYLAPWHEWYGTPWKIHTKIEEVAVIFDLYARARDHYGEIRHYLDKVSGQELDQVLAETAPVHEDFLRIYSRLTGEPREGLDYEGLRISERLKQVDRIISFHVLFFPDSLEGAIVDNISLWNAVEGGNPEAVKLHLQAGAVVNERASEESLVPSHMVEWNLDDVLISTGEKKGPATSNMMLWASGLRQDIRSVYRGETPLHYAAGRGHSDVAEVLLGAGANPNARNTARGRTPLHQAAEAGYAGITKMLLEAGAEVNVRGTFNNVTPLHLAAIYGHPDIVSVLFEAGADSNAAGVRGVTPLHQAVASNRESGSNANFPGMEIIEALLAKGADPMASDDDGETPLHWASRLGYAKEAEVLLEGGASPIAKDKEGNTALHTVAMRPKPSAETAERSGAEIGVTEQGFLEVSKVLLRAGARADEKNDSGETPLDLAIREGHEDLVQLLRTADGLQDPES